MAADVPFSAIDHVQLAMPGGEEERARQFYVDVLGLIESSKPKELAERGGVWFRSGEVAIHLGVDPNFRPSTKAHPAFRCANYGVLLEQLAHHGVTIIRDQNPFEGKEHCYISDTFGNRIELLSE